jgi:hypothetical protein
MGDTGFAGILFERDFDNKTKKKRTDVFIWKIGRDGRI